MLKFNDISPFRKIYILFGNNQIYFVLWMIQQIKASLYAYNVLWFALMMLKENSLDDVINFLSKKWNHLIVRKYSVVISYKLVCRHEIESNV